MTRLDALRTLLVLLTDAALIAALVVHYLVPLVAP